MLRLRRTLRAIWSRRQAILFSISFPYFLGLTIISIVQIVLLILYRFACRRADDPQREATLYALLCKFHVVYRQRSFLGLHVYCIMIISIPFHFFAYLLPSLDEFYDIAIIILSGEFSFQHLKACANALLDRDRKRPSMINCVDLGDGKSERSIFEDQIRGILISNRNLLESLRTIKRLKMSRSGLEYVHHPNKWSRDAHAIEYLSKINRKRQKIYSVPSIESALEIKIELERQKQHLIELISDKTSLCLGESETLKVNFLYVFSRVAAIHTLLCLYILHTALVIVAQNQAWHSLAEERQILPRFNGVDRLLLFQEIMFVALSDSWVLNSVVQALGQYRTVITRIIVLNNRFDTFFKKVLELRKLEMLAAKATHNRERQLALVKAKSIESDRAATELYICFVASHKRMKKSLAYTHKFMAKCTVGMLILFVLGLLMLRSTKGPGGDLILVLISNLCSVGGLNAVLTIGATVNYYCMKAIGRAWPLLVTGPNCVCGYMSMRDIIAEHTREFEDETLMKISHFYKESDDESSGHLENETAAISTHTSLLWRKIMTDQNHLKDMVTCRLFGFVNMDYATIMRFNFGALSLALLFLDHY